MKRSPDTFWDEFATHYEGFLRHVRRAYTRLLSFVAAHCDQAMDVVEIGTGTGVIAMALADQVAHVDAVDPSRAMIGEAMARQAEAGITNVQFSVRSGYNTAFPPHRYDLVVVSNVLHVIDQPERLLREAARVTKAEGTVLIATYCHGESALSRLVSGLMSLRGFRAPQKWSIAGLMDFLCDCGFTVRDSIVIGGVIPLVAVAASRPGRPGRADRPGPG
jgi:ubiquinone/menaquinone biosynthesis C-methylase UbiE